MAFVSLTCKGDTPESEQFHLGGCSRGCGNRFALVVLLLQDIVPLSLGAGLDEARETKIGNMLDIGTKNSFDPI